MSVRVSVIIKALNEAANIERAVKSAVDAVQVIGGEVILADSLSSDATVEIASKYPIRIVQLVDPEDRSCGVGAQLGYQHAKGDFIYILDGDMELSTEFLQEALALLEKDPGLAGVAGRVREMNVESIAFANRVKRADEEMPSGEVGHLAMGGLYRRSAIAQIGYLTNRNLHSFEEFELGIRLRAAGWRLARLTTDSLNHYGHTLPTYALLKKRWQSRYIFGTGELVRASLGRRHFPLLLKEMRALRLYAVVFVWWCALAVLLLSSFRWPFLLLIFLAVLALPFIAMIIKRRDINTGVYSVIAWQYFTAGLVVGFLRGQRDPAMLIQSRVITG